MDGKPFNQNDENLFEVCMLTLNIFVYYTFFYILYGVFYATFSFSEISF